MRRLPIAFVIAAAVVACVLTACGTKPVAERTVNDPGLEARMLIAAHSSEFRDAVVTRIVEALRGEQFFIKVIDAGALNAEDTESFGAILIVDRCHAGRMSGAARDFLDGLTNKGEVVLLVTASASRWRPEQSGVDAVTCASNMADADAVAADLVVRTRARLADG